MMCDKHDSIFDILALYDEWHDAGGAHRTNSAHIMHDADMLEHAGGQT
jgi:hypothetical protein